MVGKASLYGRGEESGLVWDMCFRYIYETFTFYVQRLLIIQEKNLRCSDIFKSKLQSSIIPWKSPEGIVFQVKFHSGCLVATFYCSSPVPKIITVYLWSHGNVRKCLTHAIFFHFLPSTQSLIIIMLSHCSITSYFQIMSF